MARVVHNTEVSFVVFLQEKIAIRMIFYNNSLEMKMIYYTQCAMQRYKNFLSKVYFDVKNRKEHKKFHFNCMQYFFFTTFFRALY